VTHLATKGNVEKIYAQKEVYDVITIVITAKSEEPFEASASVSR
jgi:hypothetical protein